LHAFLPPSALRALRQDSSDYYFFLCQQHILGTGERIGLTNVFELGHIELEQYVYVRQASIGIRVILQLLPYKGFENSGNDVS
jgi:hypothetical protein